MDPSPTALSVPGYAANTIVILKDWGKYGRAERTTYHLDLLEVLPTSDGSTSNRQNQDKQDVCGVTKLLECMPSVSGKNLSRKQRRALRGALLRFNRNAARFHQEQLVYCYEPPVLPLRLNVNSKMYFGYEKTRMAFCVDASPTLTYTVGSGDVCCPLDRLPVMASIYFKALAESIPCPSALESGLWQPELAVSVIAVFPSEAGVPDFSLMVRDYRINSKESAEELARLIKRWVSKEVEYRIATRLSRSEDRLRRSADSWIIPSHQSSLHDILEAADSALDTLSSVARPLITIATDCRSISGENVNVSTYPDCPISFIDLSFPESEESTIDEDNMPTDLLSFDPNPGYTPLHFSSNYKALHHLSRRTRGCFWNEELLKKAAGAKPGDAGGAVATSHDAFFASVRHSAKPNAIQWNTYFSMSQLSQMVSSQTLGSPMTPVEDSSDLVVHPVSTYMVNPIPLKGLIILRCKEGYRVTQFGLSPLDPGRVSIEFVLSLDPSTALFYELVYNTLSGNGGTLGFAHVKVGIAGDPILASIAKKEIELSLTSGTVVGSKIGITISDIRRQDQLHSSLSAVTFANNLLISDAGELNELLCSLTDRERNLHFRAEEFDVVCVRNVLLDDGKSDNDDGSEELFDALSSLAIETLADKMIFHSEADSLQGTQPFCIYELFSVEGVSRLFTIRILSLEWYQCSDRFKMMLSLKSRLADLTHSRLMQIQMAKFLVTKSNQRFDSRFLMMEKQQYHAKWELVLDPQLLPLLIKRRVEIGNFYLLESRNDHALFAKLVFPNDQSECPGTLVQYQLRVTNERVMVDLRMESLSGDLFWNRHMNKESQFYQMYNRIRRRDQECNRALQSRTNLLQLFEETVETDPTRIAMDAHHLLEYASQQSRRLPAFNHQDGRDGIANDTLRSLTKASMIKQTLCKRVAVLNLASYAEEFSGDWFLAEFDGTVALVNIRLHTSLPSENEEQRYFDMVAFVVSVGDLYNKIVSLTDEEGEFDQGKEHFQVSELLDTLEMEHALNFASAAYSAVTRQGVNEIPSMDFKAVLCELQFVEIANILIAGEARPTTTLSSLLSTITVQVDEADGVTYYAYRSDGEGVITERETESEVTDMVSEATTVSVAHDSEIEAFPWVDADQATATANDSPPTPIFLQFILDESPISLSALNILRQSAKLSVLASVFSTDDEKQKILPPSHVRAAHELETILNSHVAEQTLDRLRFHGMSIGTEDLHHAKRCIKRTRSVCRSIIDLKFYVSSTDSTNPALIHAGYGNEIRKGYQVFREELAEGNGLSSRSISTDSFFVQLSRIGPEPASLPLFCFLDLRPSLGKAFLTTFHPEGLEWCSAEHSRIYHAMSDIVHRTNQLLMLKHLHENKAASKLMIKTDIADEDKESDAMDFPPFACPEQSCSKLSLFHRCATNPGQVARLLENNVLHIFSLANRRRTFVYKDEDGFIFYLQLGIEGGGLEPDGVILFKVFGLEQPSESLVGHLCRMLKRRLLMIALDMLASLLTNNPRYTWKNADLRFIEDFETTWIALSDERKEPSQISKIYDIPHFISDPGMILLLFRQNLCGSTFFNPLYSTSQFGASQSEASLSMQFYYNSTVSKLDPGFQAMSTLTNKGSEYARQAGKGIAVVRLSLIDSEKKQSDELPHFSLFTDNVLPDNRGQFSLTERQSSTNGYYGIRVTVTGAALRTNYIHDWILLTLNQVARAWSIETLLSIQEKLQSHDETGQWPWHPSFSSLYEILYEASDLPHPAVRRLDFEGTMRATSLSSYTQSLLQDVVLKEMGVNLRNTEVQSTILSFRRSSKSRSSESVSFVTRDGMTRVYREGNVVHDTPVDSPCYNVFFSIVQYEDGPLRLFQDVAIGHGLIDPEAQNALQEAKRLSPRSFLRSIAFFITVSRTERSLLLYNWKGKLVNSLIARLEETEKAQVTRVSKECALLQNRCMGALSSAVVSGRTDPVPIRRLSADEAKATTDPIPIPSKPPAGSRRRVLSRPTTIRRPRLIGKSIEGAAAQAVAASRARASSHAFRTKQPNTPRQNTRKSSMASTSVQSIQKDSQPAMKSTWGAAKDFQNLLRHVGNHGRLHTSLHRVPVYVLRSWRRRDDFSETGSAKLFGALLNMNGSIDSEQAYFRTERACERESFIGFLSGFLRTNMSVKKFHLEGSTFAAVFSDDSASLRRQSFVSVLIVDEKRLDKTWSVFSLRTLLLCSRSLTVSGSKKTNFITSRRRERLACLKVPYQQIHLDSLLFDFVSYVSSLKLPSNTALSMLQSTLSFYTLDDQRVVLKSRYQCLVASMLIDSFQSEAISNYDADQLFDWISQNDVKHVIQSTETEIVAFQRLVIECGTRSRCFMMKKGKRSLSLLIVCDTNAVDTCQFIFRDGSNTTIQLINKIIVDGVQLCYEALLEAAQVLRRNGLWDMISSPASKPSLLKIEELLQEAHTRPLAIFRADDPRYKGLVEFTLEGKTSLTRILNRDPCFSTCHKMKSHVDLLYCRDMDVFLIIDNKPEERRIEVRIVDKSQEDTNGLDDSMVRKVVNCWLLTFSHSL